MKKLIISSLAMAVIASCSSSNDDDASGNNNNNNNNNTPYLLKKSTEITQDNQSYTIEYKYNGTKITESFDVADNEKTIYTYDGDNITKTEVYTQNGTLKIMREFSYINGKLVSEKVTDKHQLGTLIYTSNFQYLSDSHIKHNAFHTVTYNPTTGVYTDIKYLDQDIYLDAQGNLLSVTYSNNGTTYSTTFSYDGNNHPMKNVKGYIKMDMLSLKDGEVGYNNLVKADGNYAGALNGTTKTNAVHTLNVGNYPTKSVMTYTGGSSGTNTHTYNYEYNK
ncbi:hypothetical protein [Chryseobacterium jejuense]|uniref:DUF4595 domain-containing protein n=1 Tax=Chryseobacterium jejuense TaxID=445960 RepID=A0A2X2X2L7_CHRJE|nr:hypothetical protein [Chryseobacterium jejuense]SDI61092.1 hypothetical protein SAMN05421542_1475 [Chryseobacterium jejuense]SQB47206.1 Uncharacterised protein [Chryseobacterium jejuense]